MFSCSRADRSYWHFTAEATAASHFSIHRNEIINNVLGAALRGLRNLVFFVLLLAALTLVGVPPVQANGKGPIGIYAISRRYVLTADSNIDALVAVDLFKGGTVGSLVLHDPDLDVHPLHAGDRSNDTKTFLGGKDKTVGKGWVDPTGVASCDTCRYVYLTSTHGHNFYQIELELTLLQMARENDFSALSRGVLLPVWPWDFNSTGVGKPTSSVRMLEVHRSGYVGYMAHRTYGLLRFFMNDEGRILGGSRADVLLGMEELGSPDGVVAGLTLTGNAEERLLVTASRSALVIGVNRTRNDKGDLQQVIDLQGLCNGELGNNMWFRDAAVVEDGSETYLYTVGLFTPGQDGQGMSLYHLRQSDDGEWADCVNVAGPKRDRGGWRDGYGEDVRFTRPHEFTLLPSADESFVSADDSELLRHVLVLSDCDNRALRTVELTPRDTHHVSTVQYYDQHLWWPSETNSYQALDQGIIDMNSSARPLTFNETRDWCSELADGANACSVSDIRDGMAVLKTTLPETTAWTTESCFGCWLRFPGVCDAELGGWDADYRMVATLYNNGRIRTDCTRQDLSINVTLLCCKHGEGYRSSRPGVLWLAVAVGASALFLVIWFLCRYFIRECSEKHEVAYNILAQLT